MKKNRLKLKYDNIFIVASIIFLGTLFLIYSIRFIYFFSIERKKPKSNVSTLSSVVIASSSKDLLKEGKNYIFHGKNPANYVEYSGILFRIVSINDSNIRLVTEDNITSLVMAYDDVSYNDTYVNNWLNEKEGDDLSGKFSSFLKDKSKYLVNTKVCVDTTDDYNVHTCKKYNKDNLIGILSIDEYMNAGANNSYLNNGGYFWLSNTSSDKNYWYVYNTGGLSSKSKTEVTYHSFGVRPVITLSPDVTFISGDGTKENPYRIYNNTSKLLMNRNAGEYVNYAGYLWRIIDFDENDVKLALADPYELNGEVVNKLYDLEGSSYYNSNFYTYLNNNFYNTLKDKKLIVKSYWYDGDYDDKNEFDYHNIYISRNLANVGTLNIGDAFIYDYDNYFLMTPSTKNMLYSIQDNKIYIDLMSNKLGIRPSIYVKGTVNVTGLGTKDNPFELEGE